MALFKSSIERHVREAVEKNVSSETVSREELVNAISDALYSFIKSRDFIRFIDSELAKKLK